MSAYVTINIIICYFQSDCKRTIKSSILNDVSWLVTWCWLCFSSRYRRLQMLSHVDFKDLGQSRCVHFQTLDLFQTVVLMSSLFSAALRWVTGDWAQCSVTCGKGLQQREVGCVYQLQNGTYIPTRDLYCLGSKPASVQHCEGRHCVTVWEASEWSKVWAAMMTRHRQQSFLLLLYVHCTLVWSNI